MVGLPTTVPPTKANRETHGNKCEINPFEHPVSGPPG